MAGSPKPRPIAMHAYAEFQRETSRRLVDQVVERDQNYELKRDKRLKKLVQSDLKRCGAKAQTAVPA